MPSRTKCQPYLSYVEWPSEERKWEERAAYSAVLAALASLPTNILADIQRGYLSKDEGDWATEVDESEDNNSEPE